MTELEIEMNNSIIDLIHRLEAVMNNPSPQGKFIGVEATGVQLQSTLEFWNYKLEKLLNGV